MMETYTKPLYYFYRKLPSGKWKYTEAFNSTLDPEYHSLINHCNENNIEWKLVSTYNNSIKFQSKQKDESSKS